MFLFFLGLGIVLSIVWGSLKTGISPMPSSAKAKETLLQLIPADFSGDIYELGAGWGTLAIPLARRFPHCKIFAYELSPVPYFVTLLRAQCAGLTNLKMKREDFMLISLSHAALIVCYLYPEGMRRLKTKFQKEFYPGMWVISNTFALPGWTPIKTLQINDLYQTKVYLYKIDAESYIH